MPRAREPNDQGPEAEAGDREPRRSAKLGVEDRGSMGRVAHPTPGHRSGPTSGPCGRCLALRQTESGVAQDASSHSSALSARRSTRTEDADAHSHRTTLWTRGIPSFCARCPALEYALRRATEQHAIRHPSWRLRWYGETHKLVTVRSSALLCASNWRTRSALRRGRPQVQIRRSPWQRRYPRGCPVHPQVWAKCAQPLP
jgi:hypothetical protein